MNIGSIVKENLTEQVGVVIKKSSRGVFQVFWYEQGLSMFVNHAEWTTADQVEVLCK